MESFYKTTEEKLLKRAIDKLYNDYVGGEENHWLDYGERYSNFTEESLIDIITNELLNEKGYIELEGSFYALEPKHIRFIGKERIKEIVTHRLQFRHNKEGWIWEK